MRGLLESALIVGVVVLMGYLAQEDPIGRLVRPDLPTPDARFAWAAAAKDYEGTREICREMVRQRYRTESGWSALALVAYQGTVDDVRAAVELGADINDAEGPVPPLEMAVMAGNLQTVQYLLEKGARVDAATSSGITPLECAVHRMDARMVALLLEYGVGAANPQQLRNALAEASAAGESPVVELLRGAVGDCP